MKKKMNRETLMVKATTTVAFLLLAGILSRAMVVEFRTVTAQKEVGEGALESETHDSKLLERLERVSMKFKVSEKDFLYTGTFTAINKADSSENIINAEYVVCRQGNNSYWRLGKREMLIYEGLSLEIDHQDKKILLKQYATQSTTTPEITFTNLREVLRSESYQLKSFKQGNLETLSLLNEQNLNCKEYSVSFDTLDLKIKRVYARLTNPHEPSRTDNEKVLDFRVGEWTEKADIEKYLYKRNIINKKGDDWALSKGYEDYEIIRL